MDSSPGQSSIYSFQFWLLCASNFLFTASFNMMIPELPGYLSALGGREYVGLVISLFTLTAGVSRPFSGKLTDTVGRVPIMAFGSLVCFVCGLLYPFMSSVYAFLLLRLFHGFSTGFKPTATSAYVADVMPEDRRGEALSMLGISASVGMSAGPPLGSWLTAAFSIDTMFYVSSLFAFLSIGILTNLKETLERRQRFSPRLLLIKKNEIFEPRVLAPAVVMLLSSYAIGLILTIGPDLSLSVGIYNKGLFFMTYTISSLLIRLVAGKASDRFGRVKVLRMSILVQVIAMLGLAFADNLYMVLAMAFLFGVPWGLNTPALQAWTVDLANPLYRGRAVATTYIALEVGIGIGALTSGWLHNHLRNSYQINFLICSVITSGALVYLTFRKSPALTM
ncbi:MFS transporter [Siphonobacter sp. BAB-5385]|uniref:MFS transporter n=1 Tax=unclassified Siphonobacter TaxID=2635712 RepID=UPI000B9EC9A2|nr:MULTISPECIES: MFS transporter [unclassified Siphonobacter]OZI05455.1 MFS transporter [Siphonobacter sp. BAB-5385]PMD99436.1 MFS transporter [Siphonobacter sp. BAB-5405]